MRHIFAATLSLGLGVALTGSVIAQTAGFMEKSPAPFSPDPTQIAAPDSDTWIFSGALNETHETFSGTLLTGKTGAEFELKLGSGATCDGGDLKPETGLVRLSDITCSDERSMRALFVPQGGEALKVFGHVGDQQFATVAHLLGTKPVPEPPQTAAPHPIPASPVPRPSPPPG